MIIQPVSLFVIALATLAAGALVWPVPAEELALASREFVLPWLGVAAVTGLVTIPLLGGRRRDTTNLVMIGFILAIVIRIVREGLAGTASHTLWPIEVVIAGGVGAIGGFVGATFGGLVDWSRKRRTWR
jgi:hypothetical protein